MTAQRDTESAVIVVLPAVDVAVSEIRARLDPSSSWGFPAHITLLYPFVTPGEITPEVLSMVEKLAHEVSPFTVRCDRTEWFGDQVLWLAPEPDLPLRDLTDRLARAFPENPPYGDPVSEPIPHLTIAAYAPLADMLAAERTICGALPLTEHVARLTVLTGRPEPGTWEVLAEFPFGTAVL